MGISILTNLSSLGAQRHLEESSQALNRSMERLASGKRINRASDDAAGLAISDNLRGLARSTNRAFLNNQEALSMTQVAEGGLAEMNNLMVRIRELAIQSASDTVGDRERNMIDTESTELRAEISRLSESIKYLNVPLLNGQGKDLVFQIGPENNENSRLTYSASKIDLRPGTLSLDDINLKEAESSRDSLDVIDRAIQRIGEPRAALGAIQTRMHSISQQLTNHEEALVAANSRILDADLARESMEVLKNQVRHQAGLSVLSQANQLPALALRLIEK